MNLKRFISYLLYVVAFGYFVIKADDYYRYIKQLYMRDFDLTPAFLFMSIFPIIVGFLLALPQFFVSYRQKGSWKIDWIVLLAVALPALLAAITPLLALVHLSFAGRVIGFAVELHPRLVTVAGILFGFTLVSSLSKQESE
ncbi:MAG: hypothetical protein ABRQ24_07230 [Syntrophomonadaceae bacterium]